MKYLAKDQYKTNDRITAWLENKPYEEYPGQRRARVPALKPGFVLQTYTPPHPEWSEQFFTPLTAARAALAGLPDRSDIEVLDLCAGIGHLIHVLNDGQPFNFMTAYEIEERAYRIGSKLFPWVEWFNRNAFDAVDYLTNGYDLVVFNPPWGGGAHLKPNPEAGKEWHAVKTEHYFLELAARSLKANGRAVAIAPHNFMELPPKLGNYLSDIGVYHISTSPEPLPGDFLQTGAKAWAYYFGRNA